MGFLKKVSFFPYEFLDLNYSELDIFNSNLKLFEKKLEQEYPLGTDSFMIDHGEDYFAFFKRLTNINHIKYYLIKHKNTGLVVGTSCAILRNYSMDKLSTKFWYLCDLKIDQAHRGHNLTLTLFATEFYNLKSVTNRGYLISMDPSSERIVKIFTKIQNILAIDIDFGKLLIYSVNVEQMRKIEKFFAVAFGQISYLSLKEKKDLILSSTKKPINLFHLQHGFFAEHGVSLEDLPPDATVMFCFPDNSLIKEIISNFDIETDITATIISHKMKFYDWHDILTSDI